MQFIESLFGVSPDGGSGTLENLYLVPILIVVGLIVLRFVRRRSRN
jgi:ABC-type uncharacterized transport system involved in gliding motility auxiliary subunit